MVTGPDGTRAIWSLDGSGARPIPGIDKGFSISGWSPDGKSLYAFSNRANATSAKIYKVDPATGKMEFWKTFGAEVGAGTSLVGPPVFSRDGTAYA